MASHVPPGFVPIWLTNNKDIVTTSHHLVNVGFEYYTAITGDISSPCPLPCTTLHVESRYLREAHVNHTVLTLVFSQSVVITKTDFIQFNFMIFLSDIGGSMGLWLGLGLLQAVEIGINFLFTRVQRYRNDSKMSINRS